MSRLGELAKFYNLTMRSARVCGLEYLELVREKCDSSDKVAYYLPRILTGPDLKYSKEDNDIICKLTVKFKGSIVRCWFYRNTGNWDRLELIQTAPQEFSEIEESLLRRTAEFLAHDEMNICVNPQRDRPLRIYQHRSGGIIRKDMIQWEYGEEVREDLELATVFQLEPRVWLCALELQGGCYTYDFSQSRYGKIDFSNYQNEENRMWSILKKCFSEESNN